MKKLASFLLGLIVCASCAFANPQQSFSLPASAVLTYSVRANYNGLPITGQSVISWTNSGKSYVVTNNTKSHLFGNVLAVKSQGAIDSQGLITKTYTEKPMRKSPITTNFADNATNVSFANGFSEKLETRAFDRANIIWQIIGQLKPKQFDVKPSSQKFTLAGKRKCAEWTFSIVGQEKISTDMGNINTLVITGQSSKNKQISIWLSREHNGYPVQIKWVDDKLTITQTITQIKNQ